MRSCADTLVMGRRNEGSWDPMYSVILVDTGGLAAIEGREHNGLAEL